MNNPHSVYVLASITELGWGSVEVRGASIAIVSAMPFQIGPQLMFHHVWSVCNSLKMKENDKESYLKTQTQLTDVFYWGSWIYNHNLDWLENGMKDLITITEPNQKRKPTTAKHQRWGEKDIKLPLNDMLQGTRMI